MTLRELIKVYRTERGLSQRQFAAACRLSNGYISMLENNLNPKTGLPVIPSLEALKKISDGMGISLSELFQASEDIPVDLLTTYYVDGVEVSSQLKALSDALDQLNEEGQDKLVDYADDLVASGKYIKSDPAGLGKEA